MSARGFGAALLVLAALLAGCAASGAPNDHDQRPTFYGGITGGGTFP